MSSIALGPARSRASATLPASGLARIAFGLLLCLAIGAPVLSVLSHIGEPTDGLWPHLAATVLPRYVFNSIGLCVLAAALAALAGTVSAWMVTQFRFPGDRVLEWALVLPLAMPAYVVGYAYTDLLQDTGPVQSWLRGLLGMTPAELWFPPIHSLVGAALVLSLTLFPYVYLLARAAFLEQSVCVLEVCRTLGSGPVASFLRVALPLARPAVIAGMAFVIMETLADFGTVKYFGVETLTTGVYRAWYADGSPPAAAQLASLLLIGVVAIVALERVSRGARRFSHTTTRYRAINRVPLRGRTAWAASLFCALPVIFGFVLPVLTLGLMASSAGTEVVTWDRLLTLTRNTLVIALLAAAVLIVAGLLAVYAGRGSTVTRTMTRLAALGYATPGVVIAVGILTVVAAADRLLLAVIGSGLGNDGGLILGGTLFAVVYGHATRFFAVAHAPLDAAMSKVKPSLEDAARTLGQSPSGVMWRVHMPLLRPSLLTAGLIVMVDTMKELPATLMLRPFNFDTLAVEAYNFAATERLDAAGVPSLLIVAAGLMPVILLCRAVGRARPGQAR